MVYMFIFIRQKLFFTNPVATNSQRLTNNNVNAVYRVTAVPEPYPCIVGQMAQKLLTGAGYPMKKFTRPEYDSIPIAKVESPITAAIHRMM